MRTRNWAVVWSDEKEVDKIAEATKGQLRKWRDELGRSEIKLRLPLLEFTPAQAQVSPTLDYEREADLGDALEPLSREGILTRVERRRPFKPFVGMLEGRIGPILNTGAVHRCKWRFLRASGLLSGESTAEVEVLLKLPEYELERRLAQGMFLLQPVAGQTATFDDKYVSEARRLNPDIDALLAGHIYEQKPTIIAHLGTGDYLVYGCLAKPLTPLICFPQAARDDLPHAGEFAARVVGSINYAPNPPSPGMPNLMLRAAILYLPVQ